uniref:Uncharacterized protein n=1 Tax=Ditylenchus dipsaci TaxID=166011 RepID=A0A915D5A3_9BILA
MGGLRRGRPQHGSIRLVKEELLTKNTFAEEWPGFHHMLKIAAKPACLIAHNGLRYDYRILMHELKRNEQWLKHYPLPEQVVFVDSYLAFLDLEKSFHNSIKSTINAVNWRMVTDLVLKAANHQTRSNFQSNNNSGFISRALLRRPPNVGGQPKTPSLPRRLQRSTSEQRDLGSQEKQPEEPLKAPKKRCIKELFQEAHPLKFMTMEDWSPAKRKRLDAKVFERDDQGGWRFCEHLGDKYFHTYGNFKLSNIYQQVLGASFDAHRAQEDSIALLQLSMAYGLEFVDYVDKNQAEFPGLHPANYSSMFERTRKMKTREEKN